jgi:signal transduction histidine kinase
MFASLYSRLALAFALLLFVFGGALYAITRHTTALHQEEVAQQLSRDLAPYIRDHWSLQDASGMPDAARMKQLFGMLMVVNPSIEMYLLDARGRILAHDQPPGALRRATVDIRPVERFLGGARLPLRGEDPKGSGEARIFSAAPIVKDGRATGYLYVVLAGQQQRELSARLDGGYSASTLGALLVGALLLTLLVGLALFFVITRRLRALTQGVQGLMAQAGPEVAAAARGEGDEIGRLALAFRLMAARIGEQIATIERKDRQRRDMVAAVSHDLRTPLTSMRGYLDTLERKLDELPAEERQRYLGVAARQCRKLCDLSEELFQLAKLECEEIQANPEPFPLPDLVQDVIQKFELVARARGVRMVAELSPEARSVHADIGLIERVLVNLLDNALRHTPEGGEVAVSVNAAGARARVRVIDSGAGIAPEDLPHLFDRHYLAERRDPARPWGGLGLAIARRILMLHDTDIRVESEPGKGAAFSFELPLVPA